GPSDLAALVGDGLERQLAPAGDCDGVVVHLEPLPFACWEVRAVVLGQFHRCAFRLRSWQLVSWKTCAWLTPSISSMWMSGPPPRHVQPLMRAAIWAARRMSSGLRSAISGVRLTVRG